MIRSIQSFSSLLFGMGVLLSGSGLVGLLIGLRGANEGFSELTIGVLMSGFYVGYVIGAWWCPSLIERVGHIRAFAAFAAASAASALMYGLVINAPFWTGLRVISGVTLMGLYMVIESWLNQRSRESDNVATSAQVFSIYMMINLVALAAGQYLLLIFGVNSTASFALGGILFCIGLIPVALTPVAQPAPIRTERLALRRVFSVSPVGAMGALFSGLLLGTFWSLAPIYGRGIGLNDLQVINYVVATIAGGTLLQWPIGWLSDNFDRRKVLAIVCIGTAVTVLGVKFSGTGSLTAVYLIAFAFGGFVFSIYGLAVAQTHDRFLNHEVLEATRGTLLLHGIGAALGPLMTGFAMTLHADGYAVNLAVLSIGLALFTAFRIRRDPPVLVANRSTFTPMEQTSPVAMDLDPRTPDTSDQAEPGSVTEPLTPDVADLPLTEAQADTVATPT